MNTPLSSGPRFGSLHIAEYQGKPGAKPERIVRLLTDAYDDDGIYYHAANGSHYHSAQVGKSPAVAQLTKALEGCQCDGFDRFRTAEGDAHQTHFSFPQTLFNWFRAKHLEGPSFSDYRLQAISQFFGMNPNLKTDLATAIQNMQPLQTPGETAPLDMDHVKEVALDALHHGEQTTDEVGFYLGEAPQ